MKIKTSYIKALIRICVDGELSLNAVAVPLLLAVKLITFNKACHWEPVAENFPPEFTNLDMQSVSGTNRAVLIVRSTSIFCGIT